MTSVLHLTRDFPPRWIGGISTAVGQMVQTLGEQGVDCSVLSFDDWRPRARPGDDQLQRDHQMGAQVGRLRGPGALEAAARLARELRPSVIHVHHSMLWPFATRLRSELGAPAIKSIHVAHAHQNRLRHIERTASADAQREALAEADAVIAPSPAAAEAVWAAGVDLGDRLSVIPLGIRDTERARAAANAPEDRDRSQILYAGRFADINGTQELLSALPSIFLRHPDATAVIAGGLPANRTAEARWRRRWDEQMPPSIAGRVEFAGWLAPDALAERYATCGVLVCPSWFETFGLVVLEGMLHGAPIAASRCGGPESTLRHMTSGYLFEPRDSSAIVAAVGALLDDASLAARLGKCAATDARAHFSWSDIAPRIRALYDSIA